MSKTTRYALAALPLVILAASSAGAWTLKKNMDYKPGNGGSPYTLTCKNNVDIGYSEKPTIPDMDKACAEHGGSVGQPDNNGPAIDKDRRDRSQKGTRIRNRPAPQKKPSND